MSRVARADRPASRDERIFGTAAAALFLWQLFWIWRSWPYMLDDALIHLRYAANLQRYGRITYDGVHASFGTSSLLYVGLLACLRSVWASPLVPRVVSSVVYAALFPALFLALRRRLRGRQDVPPAIWLLACGLLAVVVAPSAVRWLDDGMETGLAFLDALLGVLLLRRLLRSGPASPALTAAAFVYGLLTVLLRVELLSLVALLALVAGLNAPPRTGQGSPGPLLALLPLLAGALAAAALILFTMHALLPDTAYAKAFGGKEWLSTFTTTAKTMLGSTCFGVGLVALWAVTWWALFKARPMRGADLAINLLFPVLLLLAALRGQQIFFIRYFGWAVFFSLLWNTLQLADLPAGVGAGVPATLWPLLTVFLLALALAFGWESWAFGRVFALRNAAFATIRAQHLEGLEGHRGLAEDVGFVGYFTRADICDPYGLVNGRAAAHLKYADRFRQCMARRPEFVFGGVDLLNKVTHAGSLAGWSVCGEYNFRNVLSDDVHYLVVAPALAPSACQGRGSPVAEAIPGLR